MEFSKLKVGDKLKVECDNCGSYFHTYKLGEIHKIREKYEHGFKLDHPDYRTSGLFFTKKEYERGDLSYVEPILNIGIGYRQLNKEERIPEGAEWAHRFKVIESPYTAKWTKTGRPAVMPDQSASSALVYRVPLWNDITKNFPKTMKFPVFTKAAEEDFIVLDEEVIPPPFTNKDYPVFSGMLDYFPDACMAVAHCSKVGNDQHNPGESLHWSRGKSDDHKDCAVRHLMKSGTFDDDNVRHATKAAWRALANLQLEIEEDEGSSF